MIQEREVIKIPSKPKKESVWNRLRKYMNAHPKTTHAEIVVVFKEEHKEFVRRCYYDWKNYVEPLHDFYNLVVKKFEPKKKISVRDIRKIKRIERILEKEVSMKNE